MDYCRITNQTLSYFAPLIPAADQKAVEQGSEYAIGAVEDQTACGVLLFRPNDSAVDILYIAVSPHYRRRGCATGMIRWLCSYLEAECIPVFCSFIARDKENPLYLLFADMYEFTVEQQNGISCCLPVKELVNQPLIQELPQVNTVPFFSLPKSLQRSFQDMLLQEQDFSLNLGSNRYLQKACLCHFVNQKIQAAIFLREVGDGDLYLEYIWRNAGHTRELLSIMSSAAKLLQDYHGDLYFGAVNEQSQRLAEKLFPNMKTVGDFYEAAWDMTGGKRHE